MVDMIVGVIPPVHNNTGQREQRKDAYAKKKRPAKEKDGSKNDQNETVEDESVVVTLSYKNRRRNGLDRRKKNRPAQLVYQRP